MKIMMYLIRLTCRLRCIILLIQLPIILLLLIYTGYEINDFVKADKGADILHELDEENSILNIKFSKNNRSINESVPVTLISSEPQYPIDNMK